MYELLTIQTKVRVDPKFFQQDLEEAIRNSIEEEFIGKTTPDGIFLALTKINRIGEGKILPGDGAIYYDVEFEVLCFKPLMHEVVEGIVKEIAEFGAFIRIGPIDGICHISQIMDDYVSYSKSGVLQGRQTKRTLKVNDLVRARIYGISLRERKAKIDLTMRQPGLGKIEWIKEK